MPEHDADIGDFQGHVPVVRHKLTREQYLYRAGQAVHALYIVDVGFLRMSELADDGREQVIGFRMGGDWIGLESIGLKQHRCDAVALDLSYVWELPIERTLAACAETRALQARLHEALAREIRGDWSWMLALGTLGAENRLAAFLLDLAERRSRLGLVADRLLIPMRRIDIANYLAIKHETVSRALSRLERQGLVAVRGRDVRILDMPGLAREAHATPSEDGGVGRSRGSS
ncbi:MAG TPA: helix-turn-helix domain-containing protein [Dokdonella sp.]|nr:helix-turn-helix domain-containing protein [Dokdonella sp.]